MRDPLIVRILIPLGFAIALFFVVDFVVTLKHLALVTGRHAESRTRRRTKIRGLAGILLITLLGIVAAVTFQYRRTVSERRVQEHEAVNPDDPRPRQNLRELVKLELLAFLVPAVLGSLSGLVLRRIEQRRLSRVPGEARPSGGAVAPR